MDNLYVEGSEYLPLVDFAANGKLKLEGKAIPEDAVSVFNPLVEFVQALEVDQVVFDVNLYYFNTASSKKIMEILHELDNNEKINHIQVNWHFEEGDEDSVETAEIFADMLDRIDFSYHEYAEVTV